MVEGVKSSRENSGDKELIDEEKIYKDSQLKSGVDILKALMINNKYSIEEYRILRGVYFSF